MPGSTRGASTPASGGRLFPTGRQEVLLRAGLLSGPGALDAWRETEPWLDPRLLDAGSRRLLPLVWANLTAQGVRDARLDGLATLYDTTRARTGALLACAALLLEALHSAGIPTLALKGVALVVHHYRDAGVRPMSDFDVLVPTSAARAAAEALQAAGWTPRHPVRPRDIRLTHSAVFDDAHGHAVDLHWHVFAESCRPRDDDAFWAHAVALQVDGVHTRALAPADQLLHVCVHGEKWALVPGIRWVADAVVVLRSGEVDWLRFVEQATRHRFVLRLRRQLAYLRAAVEAPVPDDVMAALSDTVPSLLERVEQALGVRERRPSSSLLAHWFTHARSAPLGLVGSSLSFPQYLLAIWHLDGTGALLGAAMTRVVRRLRS